MTKKELVSYVAEKANLSKKDAEIAVNWSASAVLK